MHSGIPGGDLRPRPNVGFKLRNNTPCCFLFLSNPKTNSKSLHTEYIIITQYMKIDRCIDRCNTLPGKVTRSYCILNFFKFPSKFFGTTPIIPMEIMAISKVKVYQYTRFRLVISCMYFSCLSLYALKVYI